MQDIYLCIYIYIYIYIDFSLVALIPSLRIHLFSRPDVENILHVYCNVSLGTPWGCLKSPGDPVGVSLGSRRSPGEPVGVSLGIL